MNVNTSTTEANTSERLTDAARLTRQWKSIEWKQAEAEVNRLQVRIAKAAHEKKHNTVKRLQYLLTHSYYAKALAVRRVTTNKGKNTPGIDKVLWNTPASKMRAVLSLTDKATRQNRFGGSTLTRKTKRRNVPSVSPPCMIGRCRRFTP